MLRLQQHVHRGQSPLTRNASLVHILSNGRTKRTFSSRSNLPRLLLRRHGHGHRSVTVKNNGHGSIRYMSTTNAAQQQQQEYREGQIVHGWKVLEVKRYEEFPELTSYWLRHEETSAEFFHIASPSDKNNSFSVTFKTLPQNSNGVAHILEHTTLCGSEKYPVRDLFFNMYSRSLNTFMNAWTAPDYTSYPYSTQNATDFYNLLGVYLDASFFPNLKLEHFLQEGHRLEYDDVAAEEGVVDGDAEQAKDKSENDDNGSTPAQATTGEKRLKIKGVVYNEMKGAMGDPSQYFYRELLRQTMPGTIYENNSGGEPRNIPTLTHERLKEFHRTYYHPSNAKFFTYGDLPFADHLAYINDHVMSRFKDVKVDLTSAEYQIGEVKRLSESKRVHINGPPDPMASDPERQTKMIVSYLTNDHGDPYETFANSFLFNSLMLDEPRGPIYKSLIESGLAPDFAPGTGYDAGYQYTSYGVGVQGISEDAVPAIEDAIQKTFEQVAGEGIDQSLIETALHSIELSLKTKSPNFGISLSSLVSSTWLHMGRPSVTLEVNDKLARLRDEIASGDFFRSRIEKFLLKNTHKVTMTMTPDPDYSRKEYEAEQKAIAEIEKKLTEEDKEHINQQSESLRHAQDDESSKEILPTLTMKDVSKEIPDPAHLKMSASSTNNKIMVNEQATNGIVYVSTLTILHKIPVELQPYIPLFTSLLTNMGARDMDHISLAEHTERYTGGISASHVLIPRINLDGTMSDKFELGIELGSYCLDRNVEKMVDLMAAVYMDPHLVNGDMNFMKSQIDQMAVSASNAIMHNGHAYAKLAAAANLTQFDAVNEHFGGLTSVKLLHSLAVGDIAVEDVAQRLAKLCRYLHGQHKMRVLVTAENEDQVTRTNQVMDKFLHDKTALADSMANVNEPSGESKSEQLPTGVFEPKNGSKSFIVIPSSVNFTSECVLTAPFMTKASPALRVAGNLMNSKYLHKEIRERGGAYGSGTSIGLHGVFSFTSYRDPHVMRTLDVYQNLLSWINKSDAFTDKDLEEAKLQTFQGLDAPVTPHAKGHSEFVYGITEQMRQERRNTFYEVTRQDVLDACNKYLDPSNSSTPRSVAVLGNEDSLDAREINEKKNWVIQRQ